MVGYELIQPGSQGELSAEEYETYKHLVEVIDEPKVEPKAKSKAKQESKVKDNQETEA
jgi:hypothetical protein